ncbi:hypothetical protein C1H46_028258 [Malus baccata]|uniref:Uncharacterized protein n=1 Tax=Malus baccata TaxID=106549 RepID=A0A540LIQ3_MALBA|nr:hypothetical protein C1H46_028258 [Malus baccata]
MSSSNKGSLVMGNYFRESLVMKSSINGSLVKRSNPIMVYLPHGLEGEIVGFFPAHD